MIKPAKYWHRVENFKNSASDLKSNLGNTSRYEVKEICVNSEHLIVYVIEGDIKDDIKYFEKMGFTVEKVNENKCILTEDESKEKYDMIEASRRVLYPEEYL